MRDLQRVAVLGATGATGRVMVNALLDLGAQVRVVSRNAAHLVDAYGEAPVTHVVADVANPDECRAAMADCDTVFNCIGVPMAKFDQHVTMARSIADASRATDAGVVLITGYWFLAGRDEVMSNQTEPNPSNPKSKIRLEQETIIRDAGGVSVVLPDFYGPRTHGVLDDALKAILKGEKVLWPGNTEHLRDFVYVPDVAEPVVRLAQNERALGGRWIIAGSGAMTPASLLTEAARLAEKPLRLKMITPFAMKMAAKLRPDVREFAQVYPIYNAPATFDDVDTRMLVGEWPVTSYDVGLAESIAWIREHQQ